MIVSCQSLQVGYGSKPVASDISFALSQGEIVAIMGHNGAGKSTFVNSLLGLQKPLSGQFAWSNGSGSNGAGSNGAGANRAGSKDVRPNCAYLGQNSEFDGQFPIRVRDVVTMGAWHGLGFWSSIDDDKKALVQKALIETNLQEMSERPIFECSSGQLQRCFFARAIVQDAPVIVLDEPFAAVDQATEATLIEIIKRWRDEGRGLIIVLHDLATAYGLCDKVLLLGAGRSCFGEPSQILRPDNLQAYGYLSQAQADWMANAARQAL